MKVIGTHIFDDRTIIKEEETEMTYTLTEADKKLAEECGAVFDIKRSLDCTGSSIIMFKDELAALLAKVREDERERCASVCDNAKMYAGVNTAKLIRSLK